MHDQNEDEYFTFKQQENGNGQRRGRNGEDGNQLDGSSESSRLESRQSVDYVAKLQKVNCDFSALDRLHRPRKYHHNLIL